MSREQIFVELSKNFVTNKIFGEWRSWDEKLNLRYPWLKVAVLLIVLFGLVLGSMGAMLPGAGVKENVVRAPMGARVKVPERDFTGKKLVALTFDDGPSQIATPAILDILKKKRVRASFFVVGMMAKKYPELLRWSLAEGHELAMHTMYHQKWARFTGEEIGRDIGAVQGVVQEITGRKPVLLRPPYGIKTDLVCQSAKAPLIYWSVDPEDWKNREAKTVRNLVEAAVFDGAIVLLHDLYMTTAMATEMIIDGLRVQGYEFVTVSEMARAKGVELKQGIRYRHF